MLLRQACASGLIDTRTADLTDRRWWRRLSWILDALENQNALKMLEVQHAINCGALNYQAGETAFQTHWDQAIAIEDRIQQRLMPWLQSAKTGATKKLLTSWESAYGSMEDKATADKVAEAVQKLLARNARKPQEQQWHKDKPQTRTARHRSRPRSR